MIETDEKPVALADAIVEEENSTIYIRVAGRLKVLSVKKHGIPLGVVGPQKIVDAMLAAFSMTKQRCMNESCADYQYYGGRGITVCQRWLDDPLNYVRDMGLRPDGYTLERIDNDGPYSPDNCRWATRLEQMSNTRKTTSVEYKGETLTISEWERRLGFNAGTLHARLYDLGYSVEDAMTKPVKCGGLLPGKDYPHLRDQSWRNWSKLRPAKPKFSGDDITKIRELVASGLSRSEVGRRFGACTTTISNIVDRLRGYKNA